MYIFLRDKCRFIISDIQIVHVYEGTCSVMVIDIRYGIDDESSNAGGGCLYFQLR